MYSEPRKKMNEVTVDTGEANAPIQAGITYNGSINTSGSIDLQTPIHISPDGLLYNPSPYNLLPLQTSSSSTWLKGRQTLENTLERHGHFYPV